MSAICLGQSKVDGGYLLSYQIEHPLPINPITLANISDRLLQRPKFISAVAEWCATNCSGYYQLDGETLIFLFELKEDMTLFRVRFG